MKNKLLESYETSNEAKTELFSNSIPRPHPTPEPRPRCLATVPANIEELIEEFNKQRH